jgi:hypothetical protein
MGGNSGEIRCHTFIAKIAKIAKIANIANIENARGNFDAF